MDEPGSSSKDNGEERSEIVGNIASQGHMHQAEVKSRNKSNSRLNYKLIIF